MKKISLIILVFFGLANMAAMFQSFNYLEAKDFKQWLEDGKPVIVVDIQVAEEFAAHHFSGSIETNAYPVKSDDDRRKIDQVVTAFEKTGHDVVVICPRGGGGAKRCYSYLKSRGVPEAKLTILKGGVAKWPYKDLLASK